MLCSVPNSLYLLLLPPDSFPLLQHGSFHGFQSIRTCVGLLLCRTIHVLQLSFKAYPTAAVGSSAAHRDLQGSSWTSMVYRDLTCFTMVFTKGCSGISAPVVGEPLFPPSLTWCLQSCFSLFSLLLCLSGVFAFSQLYYHRGITSWPWGQHLASLHRGYQTLAT